MFAHVQILQLMARKLRHQKNMRVHLNTRCTVHLHGGETERFLGEIILSGRVRDPGEACLALAVSSSPKPWIDVFAISEKFYMAVTQSDLNPKVRKMSITLRPLS